MKEVNANQFLGEKFVFSEIVQLIYDEGSIDTFLNKYQVFEPQLVFTIHFVSQNIKKTQ